MRISDWSSDVCSSDLPGTWRDWPASLQHPDRPAVARYADDHAERVRFHCWLQQVADRQVAALAGVAPIVTDLAVGVDPGGADAWIDQRSAERRGANA